MGRAHSTAYRKVSTFFDLEYKPVLKAVCARDAGKARAFADKWGYESIETDWRKLIARKDIDAVDICTPNNLHKEIALAAAAAGKMILCEKPLAMNVAEGEEMIAAGRVTVNGKTVTEMGVKVDSENDLIRLDDVPIKAREKLKPVYIMLYKPAGYLSVFDDERGRPGLEALVKSDARLYPVGRLDADSEGLQLLTNDGELTGA